MKLLTIDQTRRFASLALDRAQRKGYDFRPHEQAKMDQEQRDWQEIAAHFEALLLELEEARS